MISTSELPHSGILHQTLVCDNSTNAVVDKSRSSFLSVYKRISWYIISLVGLIQLVAFWSFENLFSVCCVWLCWWLTNRVILNQFVLRNFTLSSTILLGYSLTQYFLPIVFTLMEGKPLVYNLNVPYAVFTHSVFAFVVVVTSHYIYMNMTLLNKLLKRKVQLFLQIKNFYIPPTDTQIWIIGLVGLTAMYISYFFVKQDYNNYSDGASNKFLEGFIPFTYAPYLLLIKKIYGSRGRNSYSDYIKIFLFSGVLIAVGIGGNVRTLFINGFVTAGIAYFIGSLVGFFTNRIFTLKNIFVAILVLLVITGPITDVAVSMVIVRNQRGSISKIDMLVQTLDMFNDKDMIRMYKQAASQNVSDWDEHYFDNIFLARFCNLKFTDKSLELFNKIGGIDEGMQQYSFNRLQSVIPKPVLDLFQIDIDKDKIISCSYGDYLYMRAGGGYSALGGFRTGQFAGTGMAAFGWWYLLILGIGIIPVYFLLDLFVNTRQQGYTSISLAGILPIASIFMFLSLSSTSESVMNVFNYLIRGWIQFAFLYYIVFFIARKLSSLLLLFSK